MRPLGRTQKEILKALKMHGSWYSGCGWVWDTTSGTLRVLKSLERRGLVRSDKMKRNRFEGGRIYFLTTEGKKLLRED